MHRHLLGLAGLLLMFACAPAADYEYTLTWLAPHTHTLVVEAQVAASAGDYTDLAIPAWRPGRYKLQNYAAAVSHFEAMTPDHKGLRWTKVGKDTWRVFHEGNEAVCVRYRYFANNFDAGSSYYVPGQVYFNPVNLFAYVPGRLDGSVRLRVPDLPADWKVATALRRDSAAPGTFHADTYHDFADSPTVFASEMRQLMFDEGGTRFYLHFQGKYPDDPATDSAAIDAVRRICREQGAVFGGYPFADYHFIYRLLPYGIRHAVEHGRSASFALPASIATSPDALVRGLAGITSHEFWHVWNVKRIRPAALWPYDYSREQYTSLHWFTEGVTEYYTHLILLRAGIETEETFLSLQARTIQQLENSYAASVVSPAQASFDSWHEDSPYAHPDHQLSYYSLGNRLGFLIDARLIARSKGRYQLDDLFRYLYRTYYEAGQGVPEDGIQRGLEQLTGDSWQDFFDQHVHGTAPIDYAALLDPLGLVLTVSEQTQAGAAGLGILRTRSGSQGLLVSSVRPGSDAYHAGLGTDDLILEVDDKQAVGLDLDAHVNSLRRGAEVRLKVFDGVAVVEKRITYTGASAPRSYSLARHERPKKQEAAWLDAWFAPRVR